MNRPSDFLNGGPIFGSGISDNPSGQCLGGTKRKEGII